MDGYKIIDFKGIAVNDTGVTIPGVYNAIAESNKPLVIANLSFGDYVFKPFNAGIVRVTENGYAFSISSPEGNAIIEISADDTVIIIVG